MKNQTILELGQKYVMNTYGRQPGEGIFRYGRRNSR